MSENKMMEHLDLKPSGQNRVENVVLGLLVLTFLSAVTVQVTGYNPFINQLNQGTKIVGEIINSQNEVKMKKYGEIIWNNHDGKIYENSQLMTGPNSSAKLKIDDQEVIVAPNTIIEFKKKDTLNTLINIQEGDIGVKGHTNKVSYTVNNQSVESKDNKSAFSLSSKGVTKSARVKIKEVEVIKPKIILPPPATNKDLLIVSPRRAEIIDIENNDIDFAWTGNERKPVILEISKDKKFEQAPLYKNEVKLPRKRIKVKAQGKVYWRVSIGGTTQKAPTSFFFMKKPGKAKLTINNEPVLGRSNSIRVEHTNDDPIFLEVSKLESFKKIEKRLEIKKQRQRIRLNYLGKRYLRLVDRSNNPLSKTQTYTISPDRSKTRLSYLQNKNSLKFTWADHIKKIPELYYLLTITGKNSTKNIESVSSTVEFELPASGEYTARLFAKEKGTKGLLLNTKKIQYKRIKKTVSAKKPGAIKLKKEIIIK